jgi:hypothetical protein
MAAGLGFKTFTTGEVLTAADTNGYLMQGVLVFADATARDAAITSPEEGQFAYLKNTNVTTYYTGSSWDNLDTTGMTNPMTTTGDVIYSSSGSTPARLGIGTAGQVLAVNSGATAPEWVAPATNPITTEGDLVIGDASGDAVRLPIGAAGTVLTSDGDTAEWAAPAGGGANWSLLNAGGTTLTGAQTVTVSGISGANQIMVLVSGASSASASGTIGVQLNGDTASNYFRASGLIVGQATYGTNILQGNASSQSSIQLGTMPTNAAGTISGGVLFSGTNSSGVKMFTQVAGANDGGGTTQSARMSMGYYDSSSVITSVSINSGIGNLDAGTVFVYTSA